MPRQRHRLHCLSAFGLFGTLRPGDKGWFGDGVFIAFRLLVCLGRADESLDGQRAGVSSLPFGFWSVWDEIVQLESGKSRKVFIAFRLLVCLGRDTVGWAGTAIGQSSLPFGFWSVWDARSWQSCPRTCSSLHCLSAFGLFGTSWTIRRGTWASQGVFIAFRLLVCLGPRGDASPIEYWHVPSSLPFGFWSVWDCQTNTLR